MKKILYPVGFFLILLLASCFTGNGGIGIRGEGPVVERKIELDRISGISIPGSAKIYLTQGPSQEIRIQGQENIIDNLTLEVNGGTWQIRNKRSVRQSEPVKIYMTIEMLRSIKISGSGEIEFLNHFRDLRDLELRISGSGKMDLDLEAWDIKANISGSGDIFMKGSADYLDFTLSGSGGISAYDLRADKADVRISGSGGIEISVEDRLDARISGSGSVFYRGNPRLDTSISGSGRVSSR